MKKAQRFVINTVMMLGTWGSCAAAGRAAEQIAIDPQVCHEVNGYAQVQPIFGGCVNGESRGQAVEAIRALNLNSARAYYWAGAAFPKGQGYPHTPWAAAQYGGKPTTREEAAKQAADFFAQDMQASMEYAYTKGNFLKWAQGMQLEQYHQWGLTSNLIFHTQVDGLGDQHPDGVNRYYAAYIDGIRKYGRLNADYVQLSNEPNYSWFAGQFSSTEECVATWLRMWNRLDGYLRAERPQTKLLGPCLASSAFFNWADWRRWTQPILQGAQQPFALYNYHCYGVGDESHLAWLQMLQAQGEAFRGVRPRAVITELNGYLEGHIPQQKRFDYTSQLLFTALANPDKFHMIEYFLLVYPGRNGFNQSNILDINLGTKEVFLSDVYWLYWVLSQVRGTMLWNTAPHDPQVRVFTAAPAPDQIVTCILNRSNSLQTLTLAPALASAAPARKVVRRFAHYENGVLQHGEELLDAAATPVSVAVPAGGVASIRWELAKPQHKQQRVLRDTEFYSKVSAAALTEAMTVPLAAARLPQATETVTLRMGVYSDDLLAANGLQLSFNGKKLPVFWTDSPAQEGEEPRTEWRVEIPLPRALVQPDNVIAFAKPDSDYRLMFLSLAYQEQPDAPTAQTLEQARLAARENALTASFRPVGPVFGGGHAPIRLTIENRSASARDYSVVWQVPAQGRLEGMTNPAAIRIASGERGQLEGTLAFAQGVEKVTRVALHAQISAGGKTRDLDQPLYLYPRRVAKRCAVPPALDGSLKGWETIPAVTYTQPGLGVETRTGWDEKNFYLRMDVQGAFRPLKPDTVSSCWAKDCVEVFLDLGNEKARLYDGNDHQFQFCPLGVESDQPLAVRLKRERKGDVMEIVGAAVGAPLSAGAKVREQGYVMVCVIPWEAAQAGFRPTAGQFIGCDVALNHNKGADNLSFSNSVFGLDGKPYGSPDKWGILTLEE